jgi:hypothetical protein
MSSPPLAERLNFDDNLIVRLSRWTLLFDCS